MEVSQTTEKASSVAQTYVRYLQVALFVAIYVALGYLLKLKTESYLLLGVPLMLTFQLVVRKQPVHTLLLRNEERFQLNKMGWIIALFLLVFPTYKMVSAMLQDKLTLVSFGFYVAALLGAFCAGYCFSKFTRLTTKDFFNCLGICVAIRMVMYLLPVLLNNGTLHPDYLQGINSLLLYIPVAFVVEEVVFRGMLDAHIYAPQKSPGLFSAFFISALWGLWHLPITPAGDTSRWLVVIILMAKAGWGIILSLFWRRTGNLAVPAFSHAFVDAIRDAF